LSFIHSQLKGIDGQYRLLPFDVASSTRWRDATSWNRSGNRGNLSFGIEHGERDKRQSWNADRPFHFNCSFHVWNLKCHPRGLWIRKSPSEEGISRRVNQMADQRSRSRQYSVGWLSSRGSASLTLSSSLSLDNHEMTYACIETPACSILSPFLS